MQKLKMKTVKANYKQQYLSINFYNNSCPKIESKNRLRAENNYKKDLNTEI